MASADCVKVITDFFSRPGATNKSDWKRVAKKVRNGREIRVFINRKANLFTEMDGTRMVAMAEIHQAYVDWLKTQGVNIKMPEKKQDNGVCITEAL